MRCITPREDCVGNLAWGWFYILQFYFYGIFSMLLLEGKSVFLILYWESYQIWIKLKKLIPNPKITNHLLVIDHSSHILIMSLPTSPSNELHIHYFHINFSTINNTMGGGKKIWNRKDSSVGIRNFSSPLTHLNYFSLVSNPTLHTPYSQVPWNPSSCSDSRCRWYSGRHHWGCLHVEHNLFHFLGSKPPLPMEKSKES